MNCSDIIDKPMYQPYLNNLNFDNILYAYVSMELYNTGCWLFSFIVSCIV